MRDVTRSHHHATQLAATIKYNVNDAASFRKLLHFFIGAFILFYFKRVDGLCHSKATEALSLYMADDATVTNEVSHSASARAMLETRHERRSVCLLVAMRDGGVPEQHHQQCVTGSLCSPGLL